MADCPSGPFSWTKIAASSFADGKTGRTSVVNLPSPRVGSSLTHVPALPGDSSSAGRVLMFGGASHEEGFSSELWVFDLASLTWSKRDSDGTTPPARYEHAAGLVTPRKSELSTECRKLLVFGGSGENGLLGDMWTLDIATFRWTCHERLGPVPCPRTLHFAASFEPVKADASQSVFVFAGGNVGNEAVADQRTWRLDLETLNWEVLHGGQEPVPGPRFGHTMTRIPGASQIVLFGGMDASVTHGDTWIFDIENRTWSELKSDPAPPPRTGHAAVPLEGSVVIFGGMSTKAQEPAVMGDMWLFNADKCAWLSVDSPGEPSPGKRLDFGMCTVKLPVSVLRKPIEDCIPVDEIVRNLTLESKVSTEDAEARAPTCLGGELTEDHEGCTARSGLMVFGGMDLVAVSNESWVCWVR